MRVELMRRPAGMAEPLGRYSQISIARDCDIAFIAGQVGIVEDGSLAGEGSFPEQVKQTFQNIGVALGALGASFADIVKTSTFIVAGQDIEDFMVARTEVFARVFSEGRYPPNTILVVNRLVEERLLIEIEAVVAVPRG